jgi:ribosome-binding factor A
MHSRNVQLSQLFLKEINFALSKMNIVDTGGIFTLTGVDLSKDYKDIKVFFSVYGSEEEKENIFSKLNEAKYDVKNMMKKRLRLKIIPNIEFIFDETPEKAAKIEDIFRRIKNEEKNGK